MKLKRVFKESLLAIFICITLIGVTFMIIVSTIEPAVDGQYSPELIIEPKINKAALFVGGFINTNDKVPTSEEFIEYFNEFEDVHTNCFKGEEYYCLYDIDSNALSNTCDNSNWKGKGGEKCYYRYEGDEEENSYRISAKSIRNDFLYVFDSSEGELYHCDINNAYECKKVER